MHAFIKQQAKSLKLDAELLRAMLEISVAFEPGDGFSVRAAESIGYENLAHGVKTAPEKLLRLAVIQSVNRAGAAELAINQAHQRLNGFDFEKSMSTAQKHELHLSLIGSFSGLADLDEKRPHLLWCLGNYLPEVDYVAVVGTRNASPSGRRLASEIVEGLKTGWGLVSGGAKGIDSAAHAAAVRFDKTQLVVLAGGLDVIYPSQSAALLRGVTNGFLISERAPLLKTVGSDFLARNRLIAALARKVVIVQAGIRSGTRNTFSHAQNLRREIYVAPGDIYDRFHEGTNRMLQEPGVTVLHSPQSLFAYL